jgi:uncharacterized membrane protein YfcA
MQEVVKMLDANMLRIIIFILLGVLGIGFLIYFIRDFIIHRKELEPEANWIHCVIIGLVVNFFDAIGIGSFATSTAWLKISKQIKDKAIPGTMNVAFCIPVIAEGIFYIREVKVEPLTLFTLLAAASIGAFFGAGIVSRLAEQKIRLVMGVALLVTAFVMFAGLMNWMPAGGEATGLSGGKLIFAIIAILILGSLMTAGIGMYAPSMALIYFLGMSPLVSFPIMMGSCAFLMPVASYRFIKAGVYARKVSMAFLIGGIPGILIAVYLITSLPLTIIKWLVIAVLLYTAFSMLRSFARSRQEAAS